MKGDLLAHVTSGPFGRRAIVGNLADGSAVELITLGSPPGPVVDLISLGAAVHRLEVTGGDGHRRSVVLSHPDVTSRSTGRHYIGGTIGRYANRIAGGRFILDGQAVRVIAQEAGNSLHGGNVGFDKRNWQVASADDKHATFTLVSPNGDQGFPGTLHVRVTYRVTPNAVGVTMTATTDATTIINLTNHAYFNLDGDGEGTIDQHLLQIPARRFIPVDPSGIPEGTQDPVAGTPFDFRQPTPLGQALRSSNPQILRMRGLDHTFILNGEGLRTAARLESNRTRTRLELLTDQPGLQAYTGNAFDGTTPSTTGKLYRQGDGIALEPQLFPDSPNHPDWPSPILRPGQTYSSRIVWRFGPTDARTPKHAAGGRRASMSGLLHVPPQGLSSQPLLPARTSRAQPGVHQ